MKFIVRETGKRRRISYPANDDYEPMLKAIENGFPEESWDDEMEAYVLPEKEIEFWRMFFKTYISYREDLEALGAEYDIMEVEAVFFSLLGPGNVIKRTKAVLQERFNTETARLIATYCSDGQEDLYQQDDGRYFVIGEGGPTTWYGRVGEDNSMCYGKRSYSLTSEGAKDWLWSRFGEESPEL